MSRSTLCIVALIVLLPSAPAVNAQPPRTDALDDPLPPFAIARLGNTRLRHENLITALAYSPNGKILAAAESNSVRLWDPATGKLLRHLREALFESLSAVAFSPDGKWLAVGGWHCLTVYEVETGKLRTNLFETLMEVKALHFSPDGRTLMAGDGKVVMVWNVATGKRLLTPADKMGCALIAATAPDDKTILGLSSRNMLSRWRVGDGKLLERWCPTRAEPLNVAALSADGKKLALGFLAGALFVCDPATGKKYPALAEPPTKANTLSFSNDGEFLIADDDSKYYVWRVATGQRLHAQRLYSSMALPFTVAPGGGTFACVGFDRVRLLDPVTGKERLPEGRLSAPVQEVFFTGIKGKLVAATWEKPSYKSIPDILPEAMRFWDAATGQAVGQWPGPVSYKSVIAINPKSDLLAFFGGEEGITLGNVTGKPTPQWKVEAEDNRRFASLIRFCPDGSRFAVVWRSSQYDHKNLARVCVWDAATRKKIGDLEVNGEFAHTLTFSPNLDTIVFVGKIKLLIWNPVTGRQRALKIGGVREAVRISLSPDGRLLAVSTALPLTRFGTMFNLNVNVYEMATGSRIWSFGPVWGGTLIDLAFTHDRRTLFGAHDREVIAWKATTGKERGRLNGHEGSILCLTLSSDGRRLLTGSDDYTALIWDVPAFLAAKPTPARKLTAAELQAYWDDLADLDAAVAYRAVDSLVAASGQAVSLLAKKVLPAQPLDRKALAKLFAELDDKQFAVRERALAALQKYGEVLVPMVEQRLRQPPSLEMKRRLEKLLEQVTPETPGPETLRAVRTVAVLEYLGTPAAGKLLAALADGAPEARLTQEAQAALRRLAATQR